MTGQVHNLLTDDCGSLAAETIQPVLRHPAFTLEHIVSRGAASPEGYWYDQPQPEWVMLLRGSAELQFDNGDTQPLRAGDSLTIPAHCRHRVASTSADALWLALHYQEAEVAGS